MAVLSWLTCTYKNRTPNAIISVAAHVVILGKIQIHVVAIYWDIKKRFWGDFFYLFFDQLNAVAFIVTVIYIYL